MTLAMRSVGVLASGRGSNFHALLAKQAAGYFNRAKIVCLICDRLDAPALEIGQQSAIPAYAILPRDHGSKAEYEEAVISAFQKHDVSLVALAGYMRIVGPTLLEHFAGRIINIHPSLLPSFPGLHAQRQALEHGVRVSGCTVHFVDPGIDAGPIIAQRSVAVMPGDTVESLSSRILEQEHALYAESIKRITEQDWSIIGRSVEFL